MTCAQELARYNSPNPIPAEPNNTANYNPQLFTKHCVETTAVEARRGGVEDRQRLSIPHGTACCQLLGGPRFESERKPGPQLLENGLKW